MTALAHPRQMLLIHGAWQGGWSFGAWLPELNRLGWEAHTVDLPGNGCDPADRTAPEDVSLALYVEHALAALQRIGPAVVVGHSGGGIVASQLAEAAPDEVRALVFLAGIMLPSGMRFVDVLARCAAAQPEVAGFDIRGIGPHLLRSADGLTTTVPPDAARHVFLHDVHAADPALATAAIQQLNPQPERGRGIAPQLSVARHGRVPRIYVEALQDRSLLLPVQRRMQLLSPGARRLSLDCGHVPQLAQPRRLAELLCVALDAAPARPAPPPSSRSVTSPWGNPPCRVRS